jgi:cytochrome c oxidase subunit I+III
MAVAEPSVAVDERLDRLERVWKARPGVLGWLTTTDHKRIGLLYFWATLVFFGIGGTEALVMRTQLATPNNDLVSPETYDQLFSLHGITMIFFFIIPMTTGGFGNYLIPLMIGARDMAFPRLNALTFWIFLGSGIFLYTSFALGMAPDAGWFDYVPLASRAYDPGRNIDFYCLGIIFNSLASTLTAGQFIVTILKYRAPGMSFNRMPLFVFAQLAAAFGLLFALPFLSTDATFLYLDRNVGTHFFDAAQGGSALLWQNLFWIFGHPEVYILIVPAFGIATSIIPTFTRRKMVAFPLVAIAELLVVFIGFGVWAHHMFATGLSTIALTFFAAATAMVVIPSTIQVFAWCMSFVLGTTSFTTPLLFIAGFIFMFVAGGLSGIMFLAVPFDQQVTDTYFVIAHFHYIIFGAAVFPIFGGMYFWFPKITGKRYFERPGQISFWIIFVGTNLLFFPMHIVGLLGMPRRNYTYPSGLGWAAYNLAETIGGFVTLVGILVLLGNLVVSYRKGAPAGPDPWRAPTLEWSVPSPPPEYNFAVIPKVTSAYANWDADDRAEDARNLERGVLVLDQGPEQVSTSPADANLSAIVAMPHESPYPILLAVTLSLVFAALVVARNGVALVMGILCLLVLVAWHARDPRSGDVGDSAGAEALGDAPGATTAAVAARAARTLSRRRGRPTAWWGMMILIASEATLFAAMIGSYYYLRFNAAAWPPRGVPEPRVAVPVALALVLALTSGPLQLAAQAARNGRAAAARTLVLAALVVQAAYLAYALHDYRDQLHASGITRDAYSSIYYTLLGADHAHVALGMLFDLWLLAKLTRGLTSYRADAAQAIAWYWHFVNLATLVVTATLLSARL